MGCFWAGLFVCVLVSAIPNGSPAGLLPASPSAPTIEVHGPYQVGGGYPAVNGASSPSLFSSNIPPKFKPTETGMAIRYACMMMSFGVLLSSGLGLPSVFASETGAVSMSSFESMSPYLEEAHWGLHGGMPADPCTSSYVWTRLYSLVVVRGDCFSCLGRWANENTCTGSNPMAEREC